MTDILERHHLGLQVIHI